MPYQAIRTVETSDFLINLIFQGKSSDHFESVQSVVSAASSKIEERYSSGLMSFIIAHSIRENNIIIPQINFVKDKIEIKNKVVFSSYIKGKDFYGWKIKITEKSGFIRTTYYSENGKNVADEISLFWDSNKNSFIKYEVDRSQW